MQESDLMAKEASYIQPCGYIPTDQISQREWDAMVKRNEMSRGEYHGEDMHPRFVRR